MLTLLLHVHLSVLGVLLVERDFSITFDEFSEGNITLAADVWLGICMVYDEYYVLRSFKIRTSLLRSNLVSHTPDLVLEDAAHSLDAQDGSYTEVYVYDRLNFQNAASAPR